MKSIRVLKGMQQCEDSAPPPEPSGQRKQMAALCMLQKRQKIRGDNGGSTQLEQVSVVTRFRMPFLVNLNRRDAVSTFAEDALSFAGL